MTLDYQNILKGGRVAICVPCSDYVHQQFTLALASMMAEMDHNIPTVLMMSGASEGAFKSRNMCLEGIEQMEKQGVKVEWIMWIDSDMMFPTNMVSGLLSREKDIVGGSYVRRSPPYEVLGKSLGGNPQDVGSTGIVEVAGLPAGALLTRRDIFRKLKKPYWRCTPDEGSGQHIPEDYTFCVQARALGYSVWMDVALTATLAHIGHQEFRVPKEEPKRSSLILPKRAALQ